MNISDSDPQLSGTGNNNKLFVELDIRITAFEQKLFDSNHILRKERLGTLQKLYKTYESLRRESTRPDTRPCFQIQITTYNTPQDLKRLLMSLRDELLYFSFPSEKITVLIIDDSDMLNALQENKFIACEAFPWPFDIFYYGPHEQKLLLTEYVESSGLPIDSITRLYNKTSACFTSADPIVWGHKGVAGAMNMAFLASRKHSTQSTWTISFDEDVTLGTYIKVKGGHFEHHHPFSYFHRAVRVLNGIKDLPSIDLILAASVGDYCTPKLAWKTVDNFIKNFMNVADPGRIRHLVSAFINNFPTYDLVYNNDPYTHRDSYLQMHDGDLARGILGLKGQNTSGNHMFLSPRLIQDLPYCYFGPGRIADARFFLMIQNDPRFRTATESSLCVSHTKNSEDPAHELVQELSTHMHDEYAYIGFNYALFFLTYVNKFTYQDWDISGNPQLRENICESLLQKIPFELKEEDRTAAFYHTVTHGLTLIKRTLSLQKHDFQDLDSIITTLSSVHEMLQAMTSNQKDHILKGVDLFFQTAEHFSLWQKIICTHNTHEPVLE